MGKRSVWFLMVVDVMNPPETVSEYEDHQPEKNRDEQVEAAVPFVEAEQFFEEANFAGEGEGCDGGDEEHGCHVDEAFEDDGAKEGAGGEVLFFGDVEGAGDFAETGDEVVDEVAGHHAGEEDGATGGLFFLFKEEAPAFGSEVVAEEQGEGEGEDPAEGDGLDLSAEFLQVNGAEGEPDEEPCDKEGDQKV